MADVAAHAGVSTTTVSHVLSDRRPVAETTRQRVLEAIEALGYRPSELARSLRTQRTNTVALLIPDITNPFYPMLARGLQDSLKVGGYHSVVCNTDGDRDEELTFLDEMVARSVDGIVIVGFGTDEKHLQRVEAAGIPVVAFGPQFTLDAADIVGADDQVGMAEAARYLIGRGRTPVGFVGPSSDAGPGRMRRLGYEDALVEAGLPLDPGLVAGADYTRESGVEAIRALLDGPVVPRGVVCANDLIAIGVLDVARERGIARAGRPGRGRVRRHRGRLADLAAPHHGRQPGVRRGTDGGPADAEPSHRRLRRTAPQGRVAVPTGRPRVRLRRVRCAGAAAVTSLSTRTGAELSGRRGAELSVDGCSVVRGMSASRSRYL